MPSRLGRIVVLGARRRSERATGPLAALDAVLGGRSLGVLYQPILARTGGESAATWRIAAVEALVRAGEGAAALRPAQFLPEVERAGLMAPLFQFVLADALAALLDWQRNAGLVLGIAVNVHRAALLDEELPELLAGLLAAADVAPGRLTLELADTLLPAPPARAAHNLARLRRVGVRTALDAGAADSLAAARLRGLEYDELKLDRSLVCGLEHSATQRAVVGCLIRAAHDQGMSACAEGVESPAALRLLAACGCDRAQGFLVARPLPAALVPATVAEYEARRRAAGARPRAPAVALRAAAGG